MNKLSKIFLVIIITLAIALGLTTYYMFYWRTGYFNAANEMVRHVKILEDAGVKVISVDDGEPQVYITQPDKVIMGEVD